MLPPPDVPVAGQRRGSIWSNQGAAEVAKAYDRYVDAVQRLGKFFHPAIDGHGRRTSQSPCRDCTQRSTFDSTPVGKANFNSSQPRVPRGQTGGGEWTADGAASASEPAFTTVQAIPFPFPETLPFPIPRILPPTEITPPALDIPNVLPRQPEPVNPYPDRPECVEEWAAAEKYCRDLEKRGLLGKGDYRNMGKNYRQCVHGQVSSDCSSYGA